MNSLEKLIQIGVNKEFTCIMLDKVVTSAKLQKEGNVYYICQNIHDGIPCKDKLGYSHSWQIDKHNHHCVTNIILIENIIDNYLILN